MRGNIATQTVDGVTYTYAYDSLNQLTSVTTSDNSFTASYSYDAGGNITSKTVNGVTTPYGYTNSNWKDLLTSYNGQAINYDGMGNPTVSYNKQFMWTGRQMILADTADGTVTGYSYNADGIRTQKDVRDIVTEYFLDGSTILAEKTGSNIIWYIYDSDGEILGFTYNDTPYYYLKNQQGDVYKVVDADGTIVASYTYDPWGKVLSATGSMANINPIRYRSYYYDTETELYYLNSRYYDPEIGRFINADTYIATGQGLNGNNMFAYCGNNPVNNIDSSGQAWWHWVAAVAVVAVAAAAVVVTAGGAAPAIAAVTCVANGVAVASTATTVAAGVFIGSSTALATSAIIAVSDAESLNDIADYGETALTSTLVGGGLGGVDAYSMPGHSCFVAGTLVRTENGNVPIEAIHPGDYVWAWDENSGDISLKQVVETYINETSELIHVFVSGEEIITTPSHPFYSPVKGWTDAVHLRAGDILVTVNGELVVVEKIQHEILESPITVYNFQVEGYHTYYVSNVDILVHNSCGKPNGSYEIFTSNNRVYVGKGPLARMQTSIRRLQKQGFEVVDSLWEPAKDSATAFVSEYMKMAKYDFDFGGKLINEIMSPGFKIFSSWL